MLSHIKLGKEILMFADTEIGKYKIHRHENTIFLNDVDIDKTLIRKRISSSKKS